MLKLVDIFELETKDTQDARKNFAKDWTAKMIAIVMVLFFCGYIAMITIMPPEQNSMELINLVLGYMGGLKATNFSDMIERSPERVIEIAVKGMLPRNPLGREMYRKLKVYAGPQHQHAAQQPQPLEIN